jgi:arylsulfatase A-like enzyme
MNLDLFPTLLELAGIPVPEQSRGISLLRPRAARQRLAEYPRPMVGPLHKLRARHPQFDPEPWLRSLRAYYEEPYKLIRGSDGRHELYNLEVDPGELRNLIEEQPRIARRLTADSQSYIDSLRKPASPRPQDVTLMDEETRRRLEALGYLTIPEERADTEGSNDGDDPTPESEHP